jgi:hypothetical protein
MMRAFGARPDESDRWSTELFETDVGATFNVVSRITWSRADALDVVQDAFIKAMRRLTSCASPQRRAAGCSRSRIACRGGVPWIYDTLGGMRRTAELLDRKGPRVAGQRTRDRDARRHQWHVS